VTINSSLLRLSDNKTIAERREVSNAQFNVSIQDKRQICVGKYSDVLFWKILLFSILQNYLDRKSYFKFGVHIVSLKDNGLTTFWCYD